MKPQSTLAILLLAATGLMAQSADTPTFFGDWAVSTNNPIPGLNLRARLVVSETADVSGSRKAIVYVEFQNANNSVNTIYVHSSFDLKCELRDSSGKVLPPLTVSYNGLIPELAWLALPSDSTLRCRLNPQMAMEAKNGELLVAAGRGVWRIPSGDTNLYSLAGTLNLTIPKGETLPLPRHSGADGTVLMDTSVVPYVCKGTLKLPRVEISAKKS